MRDKLLGVGGKADIDIALDNMEGSQFANALNNWQIEKGKSEKKAITSHHIISHHTQLLQLYSRPTSAIFSFFLFLFLIPFPSYSFSFSFLFLLIPFPCYTCHVCSTQFLKNKNNFLFRIEIFPHWCDPIQS